MGEGAGDRLREAGDRRARFGSSLATAALIIGYVGAAVLANLAAGRWGQIALPFVAFLLIPFDLVARDLLHSRWEGGPSCLLRIGLLIAAGSVITALISWEIRRVALGSFLAFCSAGATNTIGFMLLSGSTPLRRVNLSNIPAAIADSIVFPTVAFGLAGTNPLIVIAQICAKISGGVLWSRLLIPAFYERRTPS